MSDDDLGLKQELPEGDLFNLHGDGSLSCRCTAPCREVSKRKL